MSRKGTKQWIENKRIIEARYRKNHREKIRKKHELMRKRWRREGLCHMCGACKPRRGYTTCLACKERYCKYHRNLKIKVLKGYGNKCMCCGEKKFEFLSIDHVNERGVDERRRLGKKAGTSSVMYRRLISLGFPESHQCLCYNCNMSLGFFGYCPHHPKKIRNIYKISRS